MWGACHILITGKKGNTESAEKLRSPELRALVLCPCQALLLSWSWCPGGQGLILTGDPQSQSQSLDNWFNTGQIIISTFGLCFWLQRSSPTSHNVCLCVWVPSWNSTFLQDSMYSIQFQNVPECYRIHEECSRMHAECCKMFQNACRKFKNVPKCM